MLCTSPIDLPMPYRLSRTLADACRGYCHEPYRTRPRGATIVDTDSGYCLPRLCVCRDSDMWAVYSRVCVGQSLAISARAALSTDEDLEALVGHVQPARAAPRRPRQ